MILTIILIALIFGSLVFVHELGHFIAAKRAGVGVHEFGLGFPPRIFGKKFRGTLYSINLVPLGGFVKLEGESLSDNSLGSFGAASFTNKTVILLAGVYMNILLAYLILVGLCLTGLPPVLQNQFSIGDPSYSQPMQVMAISVEPGSPAEQAGIKRGDIILEGNGRALTSEDDLLSFTKSHAGQNVTLKVQAKKYQIKELHTQLRPKDAKSGYLGVGPLQTYKLKYDLPNAVVTAFGILVQMVWGTLLAFGGLIAGLFTHRQVSDQVAGPVGIVVLLSNIIQLGASYVFVFMAAISISLGVINALPLPALDGGRWMLALVQKLSRKQLSVQAEGMVHAAGFVLLLALMVVVTIFDIKRLHG